MVDRLASSKHNASASCFPKPKEALFRWELQKRRLFYRKRCVKAATMQHLTYYCTGPGVRDVDILYNVFRFSPCGVAPTDTPSGRRTYGHTA